MDFFTYLFYYRSDLTNFEGQVFKVESKYSNFCINNVLSVLLNQYSYMRVMSA